MKGCVRKFKLNLAQLLRLRATFVSILFAHVNFLHTRKYYAALEIHLYATTVDTARQDRPQT